MLLGAYVVVRVGCDIVRRVSSQIPSTYNPSITYMTEAVIGMAKSKKIDVQEQLRCLKWMTSLSK